MRNNLPISKDVLTLYKIYLGQQITNGETLNPSDLLILNSPEKADLEKVSLRNLDLSKLDLKDLNLSGADLSGADLSGADLSRAILTDMEYGISDIGKD